MLYNLTRHVPGLDTDVVWLSLDDRIADSTVDATGQPTTNVLPIFYGGIPVTPVSS